MANDEAGLFTPPEHINFLAQRLFGKGRINDISIARLGEKGGGPLKNHTHSHGHFFIVTKGEAKIIMGDKEIILRQNESCFVDGSIPHSVWNGISEETVMIGISLFPD